MGAQRIMIVEFGMVAMFFLMLFRRKKYPEVSIWKMAVISFWLTISGVIGAMLMYFIETGSFGGTSFFGAILFVPVIVSPAVILKVKYSTLLDLCAPAESLMLAFMKFDCYLSGCCIGKYLPTLGFQFPSRLVEIITTLIIMAALLKLENKPENKGRIYAWYLVLYGATRFVLNWFRYGVKPFVWILPAGNFWSVVAVIIGTIWLIFTKNKRKNTY